LTLCVTEQAQSVKAALPRGAWERSPLVCPALPQLQSCTAAQLCVPALAQHTQQLRDCIQLSATAVPPSALTDTTSWRNRSQEGTALQSEG